MMREYVLVLVGERAARWRLVEARRADMRKGECEAREVTVVRRKGACEGEKLRLVVVCQNWSSESESLGVGANKGKYRGPRLVVVRVRIEFRSGARRA
jgi:hypothetical protein